MNAPEPVSVSHAKPLIDLRALAFQRLDADGNELSDHVKDGHVITHFPALGLMFDVRSPQKVSSLKAAHAYAKKVDLLGYKGKWVIGESVETAVLIDRSFDGPAVNPRIAPNMPAGGLIYTATERKWSRDRVWFVCLSLGVVNWNYDVNEGLAVPVLRVPPSQ